MDNGKYIAGLDIGTTGVKVVISNFEGKIAGSAYREYPCVFPYPGWMEQDVGHMWKRICEAIREAIGKSGISSGQIVSLGVSSQRGTFIPVDKDLNPLMNSIVHSDMRSGKEVDWILSEIGAETYSRIAGMTPSRIWAYPKIKWIIDNEPGLFEKTAFFLNGQEYFLNKFGAEEITTDPASRTLDGLMDVNRLDWSRELCEKIGLPMEKLPPIGWPARQVGVISKEASHETGFAAGMPIAIGAGDQQCAAVGAGVIREGMAEITIGTSMVMVAHIDSRRADPGRKVLIGGSGIPGKWDMEGLYATAGSTLKWWRDVYGDMEKRAAEELGLDVYDIITLEASKSPPGSRGYIFMPYLYGILTPKYNDFARGVSLGQSLFHDRKDMARGILEGVAFAVNMVVRSMEEVLGRHFDVIRLTGGGSKSPLWNQIQADVYGRVVETLDESECTALGAAILGAVGCGLFHSVEEGVQSMVRTSRQIEPDLKRHGMYGEIYQIFNDTVGLLAEKGIYERVACLQSKYWG